MSPRPAPHLEFAPPAPEGRQGSLLIAIVAHAVLFLALTLATQWRTQPQTVQAEAELWSATPQAAAPRLQEPPPAPQPEPEPPKPEPKPEPKAKPAPPAPDPRIEQRDAQIALEKKKQLEKKKEAEKLEKERAEKDKAELKRKEREKEEKAAKEKAEKDKLAKEKADKELEKKKAAEKAEAKKAAEAKADAARMDALRSENLKRMQGLAGASGGENATGSALKSAGPSSSYAGRLVGRIKPNITYPGDVVGNPRAEVEVKVSPDGTILSRRIVQSSGNRAWDDAVLRAIDKTEVFPKDTDGRVPSVIVLGFRPQD
ncbi:cell envelope integrity protein TolA [Limnohabitans lacus]|uniref:Cell envelope integrity protein TolA n=1 Tax=Limnohabitans lacus TaxID=3045173 RepID=A0ABT6X392_9BURK|nr:cell envelope integrity protein TolA [Limnohabitans sp. HM2-2]MDI9232584.1 cell envelope integrity protein TolA [Limnohabitans sp. HM2-2]